MTAVATAPADLATEPELAPDELVLEVYSKPACVQCKGTYRQFDKDGVKFKEKDAREDANNEFVKELGYMQAPVVVARHRATGEIIRHWSGFRPDMHAWAKAIVHPPVAEAHELIAA